MVRRKTVGRKVTGMRAIATVGQLGIERRSLLDLPPGRYVVHYIGIDPYEIGSRTFEVTT